MIRKPGIFVAVMALLVAQAAWCADVIDRVVATVNGHVILQSDWDDALSFEALTGGKALKDLTAEDRNATLNRLIDQELIHEQVRSTDVQYAVDDQIVVTRMQEIRNLYPGAKDDRGWQEILARYDLTEDEVKGRVANQFSILRVVNDRLLPTIQVDDNAVQEYYNQTFLPQLRQSGGKETPLSEVATKIRELLTQQKLNAALADWLQSLREGSTIHLTSASPAGESTKL